MPELHDVLVIGVGSIGERHARCFLNTNRARVSICEVNASLRATIAGRYSIRSAFADLDAALAERPRAAVICTPAHLHVPIALQLVEAGIHVLIEKPLSTRIEDVDRLIRIVREKKLAAGVAYVLRMHPALRAMKSAIDEGRFGRPVQVVGVGGQHFPTYRPAYRTIYYNHRSTGGGAVQDAITHMLNAGEWLVGKIDRLVADTEHQVLKGVSVEDTVHVLTRQGSALGTYCLNQYQAPNESTLTVVGTAGTARCEFHENRWRWMTEPGGAWHDESFGPHERDTLFVAQAHAFLDAVEGKGKLPCSLEEGYRTLLINLTVLTSDALDCWQPA